MSAPSVPSGPAGLLPVRPWPDDVIDSLGHDPRSHYVETYWLGILGPSTTWLLRRVVAGLEAEPEGFDLDLAETARCLGLGDKGGRHSPFMRALSRLVQFELAQPQGRALAVRRKVPPLSRRQVTRLPASLQAQHQRLVEANLRTPAAEQMRRRGRQLALSLLELGEDRESVELQLLEWRYHPLVARESATWAWDRHRQAMAAAEAPVGPPDAA
ncbi:MAG: hypothetical protein M3N31_03030 [Actinomycetota bacterium]|nr:hypothetical protein [Actinomycetota bacterium]